MNHQKAFKAQKNLISDLGEGNAHLVWSMAMYLDEPDTKKLAADCLTDGCNDKKIDFLCLDCDNKRIVFSQGYYSSKTNDSAPANKASDLNTAAAWLFSGKLEDVPRDLASAIEDCRNAISEGEIESIELLYVHNLPESVNVTKELNTVANHLKKSLPVASEISINAKELGIQAIERLYATQESSIEVSSEITCPVKIELEEMGPSWSAGITSVPGVWLNSLFKEHGDKLFSANYRGFLGISKRKKINSAIRQTAETEPENFWVFNNGITVLTMGYKKESGSTKETLIYSHALVGIIR
ncbi:MAG: AIPR family protein [Candidatus Nitrotoga sp.]|nr:AIPR family protein [Candidatus Nitrotoga sp.]MDP1855395.1 AIPR family protein [Candidatus Nitrotoga sp.]